jgi:hypothetical protein
MRRLNASFFSPIRTSITWYSRSWVAALAGTHLSLELAADVLQMATLSLAPRWRSWRPRK